MTDIPDAAVEAAGAALEKLQNTPLTGDISFKDIAEAAIRAAAPFMTEWQQRVHSEAMLVVAERNADLAKQNRELRAVGTFNDGVEAAANYCQHHEVGEVYERTARAIAIRALKNK